MAFHISEDGVPRPCNAQINCPIGGQHFKTEEAAQTDYDSRHNSIPRTHRAQPAPKLADMVDPVAFGAMIGSGYISERVHPDDPSLRVYSYTPKTQFSGRWTAETLLARGLMLQVPEGAPELRKLPADADFDEVSLQTFGTATIHARALSKFFTVEQMNEGDWTNVKLVDDDENVTIEEHAPIDFDAPAFVADKLNGALGVMFLAPDGTAQIGTKGSFGSPEAGIATAVVAEKYDAKALGAWLKGEGRGSTPLFEIISPQRLHPVDYGDMEDVVFLGTVNKADGVWTPAEASHPLANHGFKIAEQKEVTSLGEALALPYQPNTEGLVVTSTNSEGKQRMFKVKPKEYHELRHSFYALQKQTPKDVYNLMTPETRAKVFTGTAEDVQVETVGSLSRFVDTVRTNAYEKLMKPAQAEKTAVQEATNRFLEASKLNPDDPTVLRVLHNSTSGYGVDRRRMAADLRDRVSGGNQLESAILTELFSRRK